ncbi:MAG: photosynthetic complex assembly protein PuhC [Granulosicoccus sp.]
MKPGEKAILPIWFRTGLVVALVCTLYYSYTHRLVDGTGYQHVLINEHGNLLVSQKLHFVDLEDGMVSVINADNGQELIRLDSGEDGFMRSVMRGLVRDRKAQGLGPEIPFELAMWEDGLVSLIDPATARRVELSAFGKDNVEAFTRLIPGTSASHKASLTSSS